VSAVLAVGSSGAGKTPRSDLMGSELKAPPTVCSWRHTSSPPRNSPELRTSTGHDLTSVSMTPVLVPMSRGILATCSGTSALGPQRGQTSIRELQDAYAAEPFRDGVTLGQFPANRRCGRVKPLSRWG
jgi:N-acetyl-gamma-glutamyl-phosphate reductase